MATINFGTLAGVVGPTTIQDGSNATVRMGRDSSVIVTPTHGDHYEANSRSKIFHACNSAAITFGTALTATGVTFHLYNPLNSGVNLSVLKASVNVITCTTAGTILYAMNNNIAAAVPATNTAITIVGANSGVTGQAKAYSVSTLPAAPTAVRVLSGAAATFTNGAPSTLVDYVNGDIVVFPGCVLSVQGLTIAGTGVISMTWEEVTA